MSCSIISVYWRRYIGLPVSLFNGASKVSNIRIKVWLNVLTCTLPIGLIPVGVACRISYSVVSYLICKLLN